MHHREATEEEVATALADKEDRCEVAVEEVMSTYESGQEVSGYSPSVSETLNSSGCASGCLCGVCNVSGLTRHFLPTSSADCEPNAGIMLGRQFLRLYVVS